MPEWLKGADCKSVDGVYDGSNPSSPTKVLSRFLIKNWSEVERKRNDSDKTNAFSLKTHPNSDEKSFQIKYDHYNLIFYLTH